MHGSQITLGTSIISSRISYKNTGTCCTCTEEPRTDRVPSTGVDGRRGVDNLICRFRGRGKRSRCKAGAWESAAACFVGWVVGSLVKVTVGGGRGKGGAGEV